MMAAMLLDEETIWAMNAKLDTDTIKQGPATVTLLFA